MNPTPLAPSLQRKLVCEFIGSMFLVIAAISPIILFHTILGATLALAVITDAIAVGFILFALIEIFGRCAYFNPVVLLKVTIRRQFAVKAALAFIVVQFLVVGGGTGSLLIIASSNSKRQPDLEQHLERFGANPVFSGLLLYS